MMSFHDSSAGGGNGADVDLCLYQLRAAGRFISNYSNLVRLVHLKEAEKWLQW